MGGLANLHWQSVFKYVFVCTKNFAAEDESQKIKHPNIKIVVVVKANQDFSKVFILEDLKILMCKREIWTYYPK